MRWVFRPPLKTIGETKGGYEPMKHKLLAALTAAALTAGPAMAELKIVDTSYRTGPYAANGIPFSDGYQDYFTLLN